MSSPILQLPTELHLSIFDFLHLVYILKCSQVCTKWRSLITHTNSKEESFFYLRKSINRTNNKNNDTTVDFYRYHRFLEPSDDIFQIHITRKSHKRTFEVFYINTLTKSDFQSLKSTKDTPKFQIPCQKLLDSKVFLIPENLKSLKVNLELNVCGSILYTTRDVFKEFCKNDFWTWTIKDILKVMNWSVAVMYSEMISCTDWTTEAYANSIETFDCQFYKLEFDHDTICIGVYVVDPDFEEFLSM